jgi:hypothetical protein
VRIIYTKKDKENQREWGAQGGKAGSERMTKAQRKARAKKAIEARWARVRKEKVTQ